MRSCRSPQKDSLSTEMRSSLEDRIYESCLIQVGKQSLDSEESLKAI